MVTRISRIATVTSVGLLAVLGLLTRYSSDPSGSVAVRLGAVAAAAAAAVSVDATGLDALFGAAAGMVIVLPAVTGPDRAVVIDARRYLTADTHWGTS